MAQLETTSTVLACSSVLAASIMSAMKKQLKAMKSMKAMRAMRAMPANQSMKAMKAMKAMETNTTAKDWAAYGEVAKKMGLKPTDVRAAVEGFFVHVANELKNTGSSKLADMLKLTLKVTAKQRHTVKVSPMKKLKEMVGG